MRITVHISFLIAAILLGFDAFSQENDWRKMKLSGCVKVLTIDECLITGHTNYTNKICKIQRKYFFNSQGFIFKKQTLEFSRLIEDLNYNYENDFLKSIHSIVNDSSVNTIYTFIYDDAGNSIEELIANGDKSQNAKYTYAYDEYNRKIEMLGYNMKTGGDQFIKETFKYDDQGNLIEKKSNERKTEYTYQIDKNNRIIKKTVTNSAGGHLESKSTAHFSYTRGKLIRETVLLGKRKIETNYSLDDKGNWTDKRIIESKNRIISIEREIEYY